MKYYEIEIKVISFEAEDIVTLSGNGDEGTQTNGAFLGGEIGFGNPNG